MLDRGKGILRHASTFSRFLHLGQVFLIRVPGDIHLGTVESLLRMGECKVLEGCSIRFAIPSTGQKNISPTHMLCHTLTHIDTRSTSTHPYMDPYIHTNPPPKRTPVYMHMFTARQEQQYNLQFLEHPFLDPKIPLSPRADRPKVRTMRNSVVVRDRRVTVPRNDRHKKEGIRRQLSFQQKKRVDPSQPLIQQAKTNPFQNSEACVAASSPT